MISKRSRIEWMDLLEVTQEVIRSPLGTAIKEEIGNRAKRALRDLESVKTADFALRVHQGERKAHLSDMMILEELVRQCQAALKPKTSEETDD